MEENYLKPVWFTGPQFPPSVPKRTKRKSTIPHDGYEADCDEGGRSKTRGKNENSNPSKQPLTLDSSMYKEKSKKKWDKMENANSSIDYDASCDELTDGSRLPELDIESSDWQHISDFVDSCSDSSDSDWF